MNSGANLAALSLSMALAARGQGIWERLADYPIDAFEVSAAALNGRVHAVCGLTAEGAVNRHFVYDPAPGRWIEKTPVPLPQGGDHCNLAAANGKLYLLGALVRAGGPALAEGSTFEYDPETDVWSRVAEMPTPRAASGVAVIGTKIYVVGGIGGNTNYASAEVFDTETGQWSRLPGMPTARAHLTAHAVRGRVYAIGGRPGRGQTTDANEELDPATLAWRSRAPVPFRAEGVGAGVIADRVVLAGVGSGFRATVDYDPAANQWRELAPMDSPRNGWYGSGAVVGDRLYLPAGGPDSGGGYSRVFDMFVPPPPSPPLMLHLRHAATMGPEVAPGAVVSLFGESLAGDSRDAPAGAIQLNGTRVLAGGLPALLVFAGETRLDVVLPADLAVVETEVEVSRAGVRSAPAPLTIRAAAPGVFTLDGSGTGPGVAMISGTPLLAQPHPAGRPARVGETLELYGSGFAERGASVELGGIPIETVEVTDLPGRLGMQAIRFTIPMKAPAGDAVRVECRSNGTTANAVTVSIAN